MLRFNDVGDEKRQWYSGTTCGNSGRAIYVVKFDGLRKTFWKDPCADVLFIVGSIGRRPDTRASSSGNRSRRASSPLRLRAHHLQFSDRPAAAVNLNDDRLSTRGWPAILSSYIPLVTSLVETPGACFRINALSTILCSPERHRGNYDGRWLNTCLVVEVLDRRRPWRCSIACLDLKMQQHISCPDLKCKNYIIMWIGIIITRRYILIRYYQTCER